MSQAIYLSPKAANKPALIFIQINCHNKNGWIEKPSGRKIKMNVAKVTNHDCSHSKH